METVIGVFSSRERAEEAVAELLRAKVPEQAVVFLTRSESEAKIVGRELGATVGGFMGMATGASAGVAAASLLLPGIGTVFALGFGAAALLGLAGASTGAAVGGSVAESGDRPKPTPDERSLEDAAFFRDVLKEGRSLILVRSESPETAATACSILDRLGLGMRGHVPVTTQVSTRTLADVSIVDVSGRITIGEGSATLRDAVHGLIEQGAKKILLNMHQVGISIALALASSSERTPAFAATAGQSGLSTLANE